MDMPKPRPPHVYSERSRHGRLQWYHRIGRGKRTRLPEPFGSPEFYAAARAAEYGEDAPKQKKADKGSWAWMVSQYLDSRAFLSYELATQKQRRKLLQDAATAAGDSGPECVTKRTIQCVMVERPPHAANNFLKAIRAFYKWAEQVGHIEEGEDPTVGIRANVTKSDGWDIWTPDMIADYRSAWAWGTCQRRAFEVLLHTGLRRGDLVRLGRFHNRDDMHEIEARKNRVICYIPNVPELLAVTQTTPAGQSVYVVRENGDPFTEHSFGAWFDDACNAAGIPSRIRAHSIRKTAATLDAEAGKTAHWLMSKYGWKKLSEAERYTRKASRRTIILGENQPNSPHLKSERGAT